jgi:hypothetical protein
VETGVMDCGYFLIIADIYAYYKPFFVLEIKIDFNGYQQIRTKESSEGVGLPQISSEHRDIIKKSVPISAEKNPQTGQNSILAAIFGGADLRRYLRKSAQLVFTGEQVLPSDIVFAYEK